MDPAIPLAHRIQLAVPNPDRERVHQKGATWDPWRELWWIPRGIDPRPFTAWLPNPISPTLATLTPPILLGHTLYPCRRCQGATPIHALFAYLDPLRTTPRNALAHLAFLQDLPFTLLDHLATLAPTYRLSRCSRPRRTYIVNHCRHCDATLHDEHLHEPSGPFAPTTPTIAAQLQLQLLLITQPITVRGEPRYDPQHLVAIHATLLLP